MGFEVELSFIFEGRPLPNTWTVACPPRIGESLVLPDDPDKPTGAARFYEVTDVVWFLTERRKVIVHLKAYK